MKEFIDKLIGRLEEVEEELKQVQYKSKVDSYGYLKQRRGVELAKEIVKELAEEYSADTPQKSAGGWIPVTEKLPKVNQKCLIYHKSRVDSIIDIDIFEEKEFQFYGIKNVKAWQPLPAPYKSENAEWKDAVMNHFTKIE